MVTQKGHEADLRWSHDGKSLAFVSARRGHSFIGVYTLADKIAALFRCEYRLRFRARLVS